MVRFLKKRWARREEAVVALPPQPTVDENEPDEPWEPSELFKCIAAHMQLHPEKWDREDSETGRATYRCGGITIYRLGGFSDVWKNNLVLESTPHPDARSYLTNALRPVHDRIEMKRKKAKAQSVKSAIKQLKADEVDI